MRDIKFRAWDKNKKVMLTMSDGEFSNQEIWWLETNDCHDSYEIMQHTGLKDKNGKDLDWWEGDLISSPSSRVIYEIFWSDFEGQWYARRINYNDGSHLPCSLFRYTDRSLKVIGNIHTHPELLP